MRNFFLLIFFCAVSFSAMAQIDQWRGPERDGHFPDTALLQSWPENGPEQVMEVEKIGKGYSSAVLSDGIIYTTGMIDTLDYLTAIGPDGNILWQVPYGRSWNKSFPDTRSTPVIEGERIYVQSGTGRLSCFNKKGEEQWSVEVDKEYEAEYHLWGNSETPLVTDDMVICSPGGSKTSIVAFNKMTGELKWQTESVGGPRAYASATVYEFNGNRVILAITGTHLIAVEPETGEVSWSYKYFEKDKWMDQPGLIWPNTPVFQGNRIFLTMGYNYKAVMLEVDSVGNGVTEVFTDHTLDNHHHGVILYDGFLYGSNWYNNRKGRWVCMDWKTGEIRYVDTWETKGSVIMADGNLYCYNERGSVGLVKPDPEGFSVISEFKISKGAGPHWAHPFIGDGKLLIRHGDVLMVFDIKEKMP